MKIRRIFSLVFNIIAAVASLIGMILLKDSISENGAIIFVKYFTLVTNSLILISALISIGCSVEFLIKKDKELKLNNALFTLKLITGVCALITFLTVVCYLQYTPFYLNAPAGSWIVWNNIFHHYMAPLAFVVGLIFFDIDKKYNVKLAFFSPLMLVIYMLYMIPICLINASIIGGAPYDFMDPAKIPGWVIPIESLAFLVIAFGLGMLIWVLNRIVYLIFIGEEVSYKEEETVEEKEMEDRIQVTEEDKEEVEALVKAGYQGPRVYHISRRDDKMWQVKFANGKKAIKLFNTQAEAIVFAKKLAKSQDGSIRVHSLKGRIRKAN